MLIMKILNRVYLFIVNAQLLHPTNFDTIRIKNTIYTGLSFCLKKFYVRNSLLQLQYPSKKILKQIFKFITTCLPSFLFTKNEIFRYLKTNCEKLYLLRNLREHQQQGEIREKYLANQCYQLRHRKI